MIQLSIERDQIKRQQALEFEQQRAAEFEFYSRAQAALKKLGYYTKVVDGETGPGTRAAIAAYQSAFNLPEVFDEDALYDLEQRAADGWRSVEEIQAAEAGGFARREDFVQASKAGFTTAAQYQAATAKGFANAQDYDAFLASGAPDKDSFATMRKQLAEADAAVDQCLSSTQAKDWNAALAPCYLAARARPADAGAQLALEAALNGARAALADVRAELAEKRAALAKLLGGGTRKTSAEAVGRLRTEVNALAETELFTALHVQTQECADLVSRSAWDEAMPACYAGVDVAHLSGDKRKQADELVASLAENRKKAEAGVKAAEAATAAETRRLALLNAKTRAEALIADVSAFAEQGKQFAQGLAVARELVELRAAKDGEDVTAIERHTSAIESLLKADDAYMAAQSAMADARAQAAQVAALEARRQAEMLQAFLLAYIGQNVTSSHVADLLPLSESLGNALGEGNVERITAAQAEARNTLNQLGLGGDLADFAASYKAQVVSAEQLEVADAQSANASKALETAISTAKLLLASIDSFADAGGAFGDPIMVARSLARLKASLARPSLPDLQVAHDALVALVEADTSYAAATAQRSEVQDVALTNAIATSREELAGINAFLLAHITANLTDDDIIKAVDLQTSVEQALAGPDSAEIVRTLADATEALASMGLTESLADFASRQAASATVAEGPVAGNGLAVTPANADLLQGAADDLLVLRNSAAPHLVYDLIGNTRVDGGVASLCWLHAPPENQIASLMARQKLGALGIDRLEVTQCKAPLETADLVVLRRGDFLGLPPSEAQPLVAAFEDGRLRPMAVISGGDASAETDRLEQVAASIAGGVDNGTLHGFGLLQMDRGHGGICPAVADLMPHGDSLAKRADSIAFFFAEPQVKSAMSAEQAFVAAQRGECSGIYAASADLRAMSKALKHADIGFSTVPVWIDAEEIDGEIARLAEISVQQVAEQTARQQAEEAEAALLASKTADEQEQLQEHQAALRAEYGDRAAGAQKDIADLVRELVRTGKETESTGLFPRTAELIRNAVADKWVITDSQDELADYGIAVWQGRGVEAVLVRMTIKRENAILGLYGNDCMVLGYLIDREFRANRDSVESDCSDQETIAKWVAGRQMQSVWQLSEAD